MEAQQFTETTKDEKNERSWELADIIKVGFNEDASTAEQLAVERAFAEVYEANYDMLYGRMFKRVKDHMLAEDIVLETFARAFKGIPKLTRRANSLGAWLHTVAINILIDKTRAKTYKQEIPVFDDGHPELPDPAAYGQPEKTLMEGVERREVWAHVKLMNHPVRRAVIVLHFLEDMTLPEVAEHLGVSLVTAKNYVQTGLSDLRYILANGEDKRRTPRSNAEEHVYWFYE